ncbi:hypothetical protein X975_21719, partial [Stegodyphus mimosarum]
MDEVSAVKIPTFIPSDPSVWFTMVDSTFELAVSKAITESRKKYNLYVANLPPDIAMTIIVPDKTYPYGKLKNEVIVRCDERKSQEIGHLLAGEQLGNRNPSELLRSYHI